MWSRPTAEKSMSISGLSVLYSLHAIDRATALMALLRDVMKLLDDLRLAGAVYWREVLGDR